MTGTDAYGFSDLDSDLPTEAQPKPTPKVTVPPVRPRSASIDPATARKAAKAGEELGFRDRSPKKGRGQTLPADDEQLTRRKPGRKKGEAKGNIGVTGPVRILNRFQRYCESNGDISYADGIEKLLDDLGFDD